MRMGKKLIPHPSRQSTQLNETQRNMSLTTIIPTCSGQINLTVVLTKTDNGYLNVQMTTDVPCTNAPFISHPFSRVIRDAKLDALEEGDDVDDVEPVDSFDEIIADNSLTQELLKYIQMSDEELEPLTGHASVDDYRTVLISMVAKLWD